jgi:hypothetical protein
MRGINKNDIDWKEFASYLLWCNIVEHKNQYSGLEISDATGNIAHFSLMSYLPPGESSPRALTWKELALELGLWTEQLISDGHDCHECPERETCSAFFKNDTDHEQCSGWQKHFGFSKAPEQHELSEDEITKAL